jgi:hypothetical protein
MLAASLGVMLTAAPLGLCAAVAPASEARMACCVENECPMHDRTTQTSDMHHQPSQSQADQCCIASERDTPDTSMPISVAVSSTPVVDASVLLPLNVPTLVRTDAWRMTTPLLVAPVPRHLLLAVFLV